MQGIVLKFESTMPHCLCLCNYQQIALSHQKRKPLKTKFVTIHLNNEIMANVIRKYVRSTRVITDHLQV